MTGQNPASASGVAAEMLAALATNPRDVTESYFAAENRRDLAGILRRFAEHVRFVAPDGGVLVGRDAIEPFYAASAVALPALRVTLVDTLSIGERAALEWRAEGRTPEGETVRMHGANVVTVQDGQFTEFHAHWNAVAAG